MSVLGQDLRPSSLLAWLGLASLISVSLYGPLLASLSSSLVSTFSGSIPATYPLAVVLFLSVFLLVSRDFRSALNQPQALPSKTLLRGAGGAVLLLPFPLQSFVQGSLALSVASLLVVWYGVALVLKPLALTILSRYFALAFAAVVAPTVVDGLFGYYMVKAAAYLVSWFVAFLQIPVSWQGAVFSFVSLNGSRVSAVVTSDCVNFATVSLLLMLLWLMKFELGKSSKSALKAAIPGVLAVFMVSSFRLVLMIAAGYLWGPDAFWNLHEWVAYPMFLGTYAIVILVYGNGGVGPIRSSLTIIGRDSQGDVGKTRA